MNNDANSNKVILITGAARRIGATIARTLHQQGYRIIHHFRASRSEAYALFEELNTARPDSAICVQSELSDIDNVSKIIEEAANHWGRLDAVINNASSFYPTKIEETTEAQWDDLFESNVKGAFFLSKAALPLLKASKGCIINITDIHAEKPLKDYPVYCMAKAALVMMTKSLAKELGPEIRVNAIAPGAMLWPEAASELSEKQKEKIVNKTALKQHGNPSDIADAVSYLLRATYVTGEIIKVDGGRHLS